MTENDNKLVAELRRDAWQKIRQLQEKTGLSAPAIYTKIKKYEQDGIVKRATILPYFKMLGYPIHIIFFIESAHEKFFEEQNAVNTAVVLDDGQIVAECYFSSGAQLDHFVNDMEKHNPQKIKFWLVKKELKREEFFIENNKNHTNPQT